MLNKLIVFFGVVAVLLISAELTLPVAEHLTGIAFWPGTCRIVNVRAIHGAGLLYGGVFTDPAGGRTGHIRGYKGGKQIDLACPQCMPEKINLYLLCQDYRIIAVKSDGSKAADANIRYVRSALWADRILDYLHGRRQS